MIRRFLAGLLILICSTAIGQNSDCNTPTGAMQQPGEVDPTCFPGYTNVNTGTLRQCYTFVATHTKMRVSVSPEVETDLACSFPNTSVSYTDFELYAASDCGTVLSNAAVFDGLTVDSTYTFCISLTPVDPVCNWIAESCPVAIEVHDLPIEVGEIQAEVRPHEVELKWDQVNIPNIRAYEVECSDSPDGIFHVVGSRTAEPGQDKYRFSEPRGKSGIVYYRLVTIDDENGRQSGKITLVDLSLTEGPELLVMPNPFRDRVSIGGATPDMELGVEVLDLNGNLVYAQSGKAGMLNQDLAGKMETAPAGIYFFRLQQGSDTKVLKVLKEEGSWN